MSRPARETPTRNFRLRITATLKRMFEAVEDHVSNRLPRTYIHPEIWTDRPGSRTFQPKFRRFSALFTALSLTIGCTSPGADAAPDAGAPSAAATSSAPTTAEIPASAAPSAAPAGGRGDGKGGGQRGQRFGDAAVYVDGKPRGVLRYFELPPTLQVRPVKLEDGREVARYRMAEYLESVGVNLANLKELHLKGGRSRVAIIPGEEVRKYKDTLLFSFTRGDSGKARMEWPDAPIKVNTTIDTMVAVSAYVELPPPRYDQKKRAFFDEKGERIEGIPYAKPEESLRGTRVYSDGKLVASVKRKRLPDSVLAKSYTPNNPRFSLDAYLASTGVDTTKLSTVAVVRGDFMVARLDAAAWKSAREKAEFSLAPGSEGRVIVHLPTADGGETALPASALLAYAGAAPKRIARAQIAEAVPGSEENQVEPD